MGCRVSVCEIIHSAVRSREMTSLVSWHRVGRDFSLQKCALGVWGKPAEETGGRMEQCSTTNAIHKVCSNLSIFSRLLFGPTSVTGTRSKTRLRRDDVAKRVKHNQKAPEKILSVHNVLRQLAGWMNTLEEDRLLKCVPGRKILLFSRKGRL